MKTINTTEVQQEIVQAVKKAHPVINIIDIPLTLDCKVFRWCENIPDENFESIFTVTKKNLIDRIVTELQTNNIVRNIDIQLEFDRDIMARRTLLVAYLNIGI